MKKGYSLIELVVVIAMMTLLIAVASLSIERIKENGALTDSRDKISGVLRGYLDTSFNTGEIYEISFDYEIKRIEVKNLADMKVVEEVDLSKILEYTTIYSGAKQDEYQTITNSEGGSDKSFSIYIFDGDSKARYRISVDNAGNPSGLGYINIYRNKSSGITLENVEAEHYNFNYNKWEKE